MKIAGSFVAGLTRSHLDHLTDERTSGRAMIIEVFRFRIWRRISSFSAIPGTDLDQVKSGIITHIEVL